MSAANNDTKPPQGDKAGSGGPIQGQPPDATAGTVRDQPAAPTSYLVEVPRATVVEPPQHSKSPRLLIAALGIVLSLFFAWVLYTYWQGRGERVYITFDKLPGVVEGVPLKLSNGVSIGEVIRVEALENLQVRVTGRITAPTPIADKILRENTKFWPPQFRASLAEGVQNVGAALVQEIKILPGDGARQTVFVGLNEEPPEAMLSSGELIVVARAPGNRGVRERSAVFYLGEQIGRIFRNQISRDSRQFEAWLAINPQHAYLVREDSIFVDTSGVKFDAGWLGLSLEMGSMQSVLAGSIQLFTPTHPGPPAKAGAEFKLHLEAPEGVEDWRPNLEFKGYESIYTASAYPIPNPIAVNLNWKHSTLMGLGKAGDASQQGLGLLTDRGLVVPEKLVKPRDSGAFETTFQALTTSVALNDEVLTWQAGGFALLKLDLNLPTWPATRNRVPSEPESCTIIGPGGVRHHLDREFLTASNAQWQISKSDQFDTGWNGAPVMATRDGKAIGLLDVGKKYAVVVPFKADAPFIKE